VAKPSISFVFEIQEDNCVLKITDELKSRAWGAHMVPEERTKEISKD